MKISVIVPVYNAETFLCKCIDSILAQSFLDFELLLINDGSTDSSGKICDEYSRKDERIRVFHKENKGISATREFGINHAKGEYIQFVDSDDWIDKNMFLEMFSEAERTKADIVGCNFFEVYSQEKHPVQTFYKDKYQFFKAVLSNNWGVLWKILFKRKLFLDNNIHFPKGINGGEDYYVVTNLLFYAKNVSCVNKAFYYYNRCNSSSLITKQKKEDILQQIKATQLVERLLDSHGCLETYKKELQYRQYSCKSPLRYSHPLLWYNTFKESNVLRKGWKENVLYFVCKCIKG